MKLQLFYLMAFMSAALTSCDMKSDTNYTPQIGINPQLLVYKPDSLNRIDTLDIYRTSISSELLLDTITVGDTVQLLITLNGFANNITAFYLTQSADSVTSIVLPLKTALDPLFLSTSNYAAGKFIADGTYPFLYFPFKYIAKKPSKDAKLTFSVTTDAVFKDASGSNTNSFVLKTPIKAAK